MSVLALASAKGSPGVTTAALALAVGWPSDRQAVVVELDPAGGDVGAWLGLPAEPGLGTLAAAGRHGLDWTRVLDHSQRLASGSSVLVGPPGADQARHAVAMVAADLERRSEMTGEPDLLVDCGRLDPESPATGAIRSADLVVLVSRPDVAALGHLAGLVAQLGSACPVQIALVGRGPYPPEEVSAAIGAGVLGVLAHDPEGAALLAGGGHGSRLSRSPLLRSAADLTAAVAFRLRPPAPPAIAQGAALHRGVDGNGLVPKVAR